MKSIQRERETNKRTREKERQSGEKRRSANEIRQHSWHHILAYLRERIADDQGDTGAAYPSAGAGEGTGVVQGLLQQVHHVPEGQDAERELAAQRLQPTWTRHGPVEREQWEQSVAG